jgi:phosphatidate cytidylyltransferase
MAAGGLSDPALRTRLVVGLFLAVVALAEVALGGWSFDILVTLAVILMFREWAVMHSIPALLWGPAMGLLALVGLVAAKAEPIAALLLLAAGIALFLCLGLIGRQPGKRWLSTGLAYAGLPAVALIWMREQPQGFALVIWTLGIVWSTDILAYFAGRAIGGPKLAPAISPNKTWAGLVGGVTAAGVASMAIALAAGWGWPLAFLLAGTALGGVAQAGDLFESWLKRRAGVKDSGGLLPGHGGLMDRLDGLVPVACLVALGVALQ